MEIQRDRDTNGAVIAQLLYNTYGWSKNAICGWLGNADWESGGLNPAAMETGGWSGGVGLMQWTPGINLQQRANAIGRTDYLTIECQLAVIEYERQNNIQYYPTANYPETFNEFINSDKDVEYLVYAWGRNYERPNEYYAHWQDRIDRANYWASKIDTIIVSLQQKALERAIMIANDPSHGYDQSSRWGPDYDCSSFVTQAYREVGVNIGGGTGVYTGNMMEYFGAAGFKNVTSEVNLSTGSGLVEGDVLLNIVNHTGMYAGNGTIVQASLNEFGGITGGQPGDQTGDEISVVPYYNYPWDVVLRLDGGNLSIGGGGGRPPLSGFDNASNYISWKHIKDGKLTVQQNLQGEETEVFYQEYEIFVDIKAMDIPLTGKNCAYVMFGYVLKHDELSRMYYWIPQHSFASEAINNKIASVGQYQFMFHPADWREYTETNGSVVGFSIWGNYEEALGQKQINFFGDKYDKDLIYEELSWVKNDFLLCRIKLPIYTRQIFNVVDEKVTLDKFQLKYSNHHYDIQPFVALYRNSTAYDDYYGSSYFVYQSKALADLATFQKYYDDFPETEMSGMIKLKKPDTDLTAVEYMQKVIHYKAKKNSLIFNLPAEKIEFRNQTLMLTEPNPTGINASVNSNVFNYSYGKGNLYRYTYFGTYCRLAYLFQFLSNSALGSDSEILCQSYRDDRCNESLKPETDYKYINKLYYNDTEYIEFGSGSGLTPQDALNQTNVNYMLGLLRAWIR